MKICQGRQLACVMLDYAAEVLIFSSINSLEMLHLAFFLRRLYFPKRIHTNVGFSVDLCLILLHGIFTF